MSDKKPPAPTDPLLQWWELPDIKEFYDESPDRGIAISLPAILEDRLTDIFRLAMRDNSTRFEQLFKPGAPIGDFGTKIKLAYMLRLIDDDLWADLKLVHQIRNHFAHKVEIKRLDQPPIKAWIESMKTYRSLVKISKGEHYLPADSKLSRWNNEVRAIAMTDLTEMNWTFRSCVRLIIIRMNQLHQAWVQFKAPQPKASEPQP